jgi:hypothetical protein
MLRLMAGNHISHHRDKELMKPKPLFSKLDEELIEEARESIGAFWKRGNFK